MKSDIEKSITTLEETSYVLDLVSSSSHALEAELAAVLENMSFEMQKHANDLKDLRYILGDME